VSKRKGDITAKELVSQLQQDPEYEARRGTLERENAAREETFRVITAPLRQQLASAGYPTVDVFRIAEQYAPLPSDLVALLLHSLPALSDPWLQEGVVRALAAAAAPFDGRPLVRLFEETDSHSLRWAIANTMAYGRPYGIADWILGVLRRPTIGKAREMLALAAARLAPPEQANPVLLELIDELPGHVAMALAESGGRQELAVLEQPRPAVARWVGREIERAIRKIRRRLAKADD